MPQRIPYHRGPGQADPKATRRAYGRTEDRMASNRFYASTAWRDLRSAYLRSHPLCERCDAKGLVVPATHVHHVQERRRRPDLALERSNLEALCSPCHTALHKGKPGPS